MLKRFIIAVMVVSISVGSYGICISQTAQNEIKIAGSTTFAPLVAAITESFMTTNPNVKITFVDSSASDSISSLIDGKVTIGCSARYMKPSETDKASAKGVNIACNAVALDAIFPIVNPSNSVISIGPSQVTSIFGGQITNWKSLNGGKDENIKVISREPESAMYEFWNEKFMHGVPIMPGATTLRTNQDIVKMVSEDPSAVGYTSFSRLNPKVKALPLDGINTTSTPNDTHPLSRKLLMCTNGAPSGVVKQFMDFITGPEGKKVVQKAGYIPQ